MNYKYLFNNIADAILIYDLDGKFIDCNVSALHLLGYSHQEMENIRPRDIVHPDYHELMRNNQQSIKGGETTIVESVHLSRDGVNIPVELKTTCIEVEEGKIMVAVIRDIRDRKKLEAIIKEQSSRMEALLRTPTEGLWVVSKTGKLLIVNDAYCSMSGYTREEIMNLSVQQLEANETPEEIEKRVKNIIERGWDRFESKHRRKDGTIYDVEISVSFDKIRDEFYSYVKDITEEKRIKRELKTFMEAVEYSTDAIGMSTPEGRHFYQNNSFNKLFGDAGDYPPATIFVDQRIGDEVFSTIMGGNKWQGEVKMYNDKKEFIDVLLRAYPVFDEKGNISVLVGVNTDITEQKIQEIALKESEEKYRIISENSADMISRHTADGKVLFVSPASESLTGYEPSELIGKEGTFFIPAEEHTHVWNIISKSFENGDNYIVEHRIIRKDGIKVWVETKGKCRRDSEENIKEIICNIREITERKKFELELKLKDNAIQNALTGIAISDSNGLINYVNKTFLKLWGYASEDEVKGKNVFEFWQDRENIIEITESLKNKNEWTGNRIARRKDGSTFVAQIMGNFLTDEKGNPTHFLGSFVDITEKKESEEKLKEREFHYRTLFEQSPYGVVLVDIETGRTLDANEIASKQLGYTSEEFLTIKVTDYEAIETPEVTAMRLKSIENGEKKEFVTLHRTKKGELRNVRVNIQPININLQKCLLAIFQDITESIESESLYQNILKSAFDGFWLNDVEGNILEVNDAYCKMSGYTRQELLNKHISNIEAMESPEETKTRINKILETGLDTFESKHRCKDGRIIDLAISVIYLHIRGGLFVAFLRDITERKINEIIISDSLKEKEILLQEIHHRVKNNLQIIGSMLYLQLLQISDDDTVKIFNDVLGRIKSIGLVHEYLYQTKDYKNIDFKEYTTGLVSVLKETYTQENRYIKFEMDVKEKIPFEKAIYCGLIINELVSNSLKYAFEAEQAGMIKITFKKENGHFILIVGDNGIGMNDFEGTKKKDTLGLKIVDTLAEQLKGSASYKIEKGTEVKIEFPE